MSFFTALALRPVQAQDTAGGANRAMVLAITQEIVRTMENTETCWQTLVTDREMAQRQYDAQPWAVKYWQPILGGILGGLVGFQFTRNFGPPSKKWIYPAVAAGVGIGAMAGPGMVAGAYLAGSVAHHFRPAKLPLTIVASILGGVIGDGLMKLLFPDSPPQELLDTPQPGVYLSNQQFYVETTCMPTQRVRHAEEPYRVTYRYQGEERSAYTRHYPGEYIALDANGRPLREWVPAGN